MTALPVFPRLIGSGMRLAVLWAIWLGAAAASGIVLYRQVYHFDAADMAAWQALRQAYLGGAVIPFDFVALAAGWFVVVATGCLGLALRCDRPGVSPGFPRLAACRGLADVLAVGGVDAVRGVLRRLAAVGRAGGWGAAARGARHLFALPMRRPAASRGAGAFPDDRCEPTILAADPPERHPPAVEPAGRNDDVAAAVPDSRAESAAPTVAHGDGDDAVFARIMALYDVWSDPTPAWMRSAMRDELAMLSPAGWSLFGDFGEPAISLVDRMATAGLLPEDPPARAAIEAILAKRQDVLPAAADPCQAVQVDAAAADAGGGGAAAMTMNAAWLCETVDNFAMLEDIRFAGSDDPSSFDARWGAVYRETAERLQRAMQTMADSDWRSLDRFPGRAGRIRVLSDRFREMLRGPPDDRTSAADGVVAALAPAASAVSVDAGGPATPVAPFSPGAPPPALEDVLRRAGFVFRALSQAGPGPSAGTADFLVERDELRLLLRLADLSGDAWRLDGDSLSPWRGEDGRPVPSPCRAVWQRLALLRSLGGDDAPSAGVVVLKGGQFADESMVARLVACDRDRTAVSIAWLDRPSAPLPDLAAWLTRLDQRDMTNGAASGR